MKLVKRQENETYEEWLKELRLFSLESTTLKGRPPSLQVPTRRLDSFLKCQVMGCEEVSCKRGSLV